MSDLNIRALKSCILKLCVVLLLCCPMLAWSMVQVQVPILKARVTDLTGTLSMAEQKKLEQRLEALEKRKGSQVVIVMLPSTQPQDIESFALAVAVKNNVGRDKPDDGVLLLVAKNDRKARIEVGYGLEGAIPDAIAARIIREHLAPRFRQNDYAGGLDEASAMIEKIIDGEPLPEPMTSGADDQGARSSSGIMSSPALPFTIFVGVFIGLFAAGTRIRPVFIRRIGAAGAAGLFVWFVFSFGMGAIIASVIAFLLSGAQSNGRYVSHGGGWSGGGGDFGGGGASGDW